MASKILLVTQREYLSRVRKKSFIVMTILAPLLVVLFYGIIIYYSINQQAGEKTHAIYLVDETGQFAGALTNDDNFSFISGEAIANEAQKSFLESSGHYAILSIVASNDSLKPYAKMVSSEQPAISLVSSLQEKLNGVMRRKVMLQYGMNETSMNEISMQRVTLSTKRVTDEGIQASNAGIATAVGFFGAFAIYMFIFLYGVQVMQGVIEEKTNRIVEVIISSVKPFELMMGKIIGIALVGLTQFVIWAILITLLGGSVSGIVMARFAPQTAELAAQSGSGEMADLMNALGAFNFSLIIGMFIFYFITGYLFYGSLFAAIGSAVDNDTDKQQFMLPVTLPLVFALVMAQSAIISNPASSMSFWLSVIPFTAPIAMMVRLPFGVPWWEILLSMSLMIGGFIFTSWLAGRIYRVGILMYGKKASYAEIWKWLRYKA